MLGFLHITRPILVFIRRPDENWRLKNIGKGCAFQVVFKQEDGQGQSLSHIIYPIADGEEVPLGKLKHGETLNACYKDSSGLRRYKTVCRSWVNKVSLIWWRFPSTRGTPDETRLDKQTPKTP